VINVRACLLPTADSLDLSDVLRGEHETLIPGSIDEDRKPAPSFHEVLDVVSPVVDESVYLYESLAAGGDKVLEIEFGEVLRHPTTFAIESILRDILRDAGYDDNIMSLSQELAEPVDSPRTRSKTLEPGLLTEPLVEVAPRDSEEVLKLPGRDILLTPVGPVLAIETFQNRRNEISEHSIHVDCDLHSVSPFINSEYPTMQAQSTYVLD
jgi:hypothetical protein